jgi:hypothetical protein
VMMALFFTESVIGFTESVIGGFPFPDAQF